MFDSSHVPPRRPGRRDHQRRRPAFSGCTTTTPTSSATPAEQRKSLSSAADETLGKLYQASPQSKELVARARAC